MKLTHIGPEGRAQMVDVGDKPLLERRATAEGRVYFAADTGRVIQQAGLPKGNPFEVARLAGIQAAKETSRLIPLCHPLNLSFIDVEISLAGDHFLIRSDARCRWATGVEMEALTAVSVAALTLYDMCKAVDRQLRISDIRLLDKSKTAPA